MKATHTRKHFTALLITSVTTSGWPAVMSVLAFTLALFVPGQLCGNTWTGSANDNRWNTSNNWTDGIPNATEAIVIFNTSQAALGGKTITLGSDILLGKLQLDGTTTETLFGFTGGKFIFDNSDTTAELLLSGSNRVTFDKDSAIELRSNLSLNTSTPTTTLTLEGAITGNGYKITKAGSGTTIFTGADKTFSGGIDIFAGKIETTLTNKANAQLVIGALDAAKNYLGSGDIKVGNIGTQLEIKSSGNNQNVAINGSTVTLEAGGQLRLSEANTAHNRFTLNLNNGTLDGGTNATHGTLYLAGTDLVYKASGQGTTIINTPNLVFDTSVNATAMSVLLNGSTLDGFGMVTKTGVNVLNFTDTQDSATFGSRDFFHEAGVINFGLATLDITNGLTFSNLTPITNALQSTTQATFGKANQMRPTGNRINMLDGATGSLKLAGFDQTLGTITLGANSNLAIYLQPTAPAATSINLTLGSVNTSVSGNERLSIYDWRGNPDSYRLTGNATVTDHVTISDSSSDLSKIWFRGFNPGAVRDDDGKLRPIDFLNTTWIGGTGTAKKWFDFANWSVDAPNHAGATVTLNGAAATTTTTLEGQTATIGHLITNTTPIFTISTGTLAFDSGVANTPSTISGTGGVTINTLELKNDLAINSGLAVTVNGVLKGNADITINSGGLHLANANINSTAYRGTITLNAGRFNISNAAQTMGALDNLLVINGGEIYGGTNVNNVRTLSNRVDFAGDFTASFINFAYAGDVSWTDTRTITGEGAVIFDTPLRLTGDGALVVSGGSSNGDFYFNNNNNDFTGGLTILPRKGYGSGGANVSLRGDMVLGADVQDQNYLGSGSIHAYAALNIATNGHATTLRGTVTLDNATANLTVGAKMTFTGGGKVTLDSTATLARVGTSNSALITDGDLAINGATLVGTPGLTFNPGTNATSTITSTVGIAGVGAIIKNNAGTTILDTPISATSLTLNGGAFVLNRNASILDAPSVTLAAGTLYSVGGTENAPIDNRFGTLSLTGNASIYLEDHSSITFANVNSGPWTGKGYSLTLQNNTGQWSTAAHPELSDTYVRFSNISSLDATKLATISFTGYEAGAELVKQAGTGYWFLAPTGSALTEWRGSADTGIPVDRLWSTASNWVGDIAPNRAGIVAAIRDLDGLLNNNQIIVDQNVTIGKLRIESNGAQAFSITSNNNATITFGNHGDGAQLTVTGDNSTTIAANLILQADDTLALNHIGKKILTLSGKITGDGGIVSDYAGPASDTQPQTGIIRFAGNTGASTYTSGFWFTGAVGEDTSLARKARKIIIATDGSIFGQGTNTGDPATSTQALRIGNNSGGGSGWYHIEAEGAPRTINASVRFDGNLLITPGNALTFQSTESSYITAGLKKLDGNGSILHLRTPIAGPGGFQLGGTNQAVNFYNANTFTGGIYFKQSYSPTLGIGADNALGTGTITFDTINLGNAPRISALDGPRILSNQFIFNSTTVPPTGGSSINSTVRFAGDLTLNHAGRSQFLVTPGINVVNSTDLVTITASHIFEGVGGFIKNGDGTLRLLGAHEYQGTTELLAGTLQVGHNNALSTGPLSFTGAGTLASFGGARTLANKVNFLNATIGLDGTAGLLTLNPSVANGDTALTQQHTFNVAGDVAFGQNLKLTGTGGLTKSGLGTLTVNNANATYTGGTTIADGLLRVAATGDVTLGRAAAGQNYLGSGSVSVRNTTNLTPSTLEIVTTNGANVRIGGNLSIIGYNASALSSLNITNTPGAISGTNIKTYLDTNQTISGNSFGYLRTPGQLIKTGLGTTTTISDVNIVTPELLIQSGTLSLGGANLASGIQKFTLGNGILQTNGTNQTFATAGTFNLAGDGTIDMGGSSLLTFNTVGTWATDGSLSIDNWAGTLLYGGGSSQLRFTTDVTSLFTNAMLSSIIFSGNDISYAPGAKIVKNATGYYELIPLGASSEWNHLGSGYNWGTAQNWTGSMQPNGIGASATFGDLDTALNGKTINVDADIKLGSIVFKNTKNAAFTISGSPITLEQNAADANAIITMTGNSNPTISSNINLQNDLLVSQRGTGTLTLSGILSGNHSLTLDGTGTLSLIGANTYTGGTNILGGTLLINADNTLGATNAPITFDGATLKFGASFNLASTRAITLLSEGGTIDTAAYTTRIAQAITGAGQLTKTGTGTLTLANADNAYEGGTNIQQGTVRLSHGTAAGAGNIAINTNAALALDFSNGTIANTLTGTGSTNILGQNIALATDATSYTGNWHVAANASATITDTNNLGAASTLNLNAPTARLTIAPTATGNYTFANTLKGNGTLAVNLANTTDTFTLANNPATSTFNGTLRLDRSTFALDAAASTRLANATLSLGTGNTTTVADGIQTTANLTLDGGSLIYPHTTVPSQTTSAGIISTGTLTLASGTVHINAPDTTATTPAIPTDATLLEQDDIVSLALVSATTVNGSASALTLADLDGNAITSPRTQGIHQAGDRVATGTYDYSLATTNGTGSNVLYLNYGLTQADILTGKTLTLTERAGATGTAAAMSALITGAGNLDIAARNTVALTRQNTHTGATTLSTGTLAAGTTDIIAQSSRITLATGTTFDLQNHNQNVNNLTGSGTVKLGTASLTAAYTEAATYSGTLIGGTTSHFTKTGSGKLTLTGASADLLGGTTIADGELALASIAILGGASSTITVNSAATLSGTGAALGSVTVKTGGIIAPGNSATAAPGTLTVGNLTLASGSIIDWQQGDLIEINHLFDISAMGILVNLDDYVTGTTVHIAHFGDLLGASTLADANDYFGLNFAHNAAYRDYTGHFEFTADKYLIYTSGAVPEPATIAALLSAASLAFALWRRRR
ncbi:PEP-CTERM sorting domain-containing protein [Opitutaceae bacterium TAV4]|nr:PEP-CTERM sorting domain-containing protein [Opitutaceae bacterium TAV4]